MYSEMYKSIIDHFYVTNYDEWKFYIVFSGIFFIFACIIMFRIVNLMIDVRKRLFVGAWGFYMKCKSIQTSPGYFTVCVMPYYYILLFIAYTLFIIANINHYKTLIFNLFN